MVLSALQKFPGSEVMVTPNQDLLFTNIPTEAKEDFVGHLADFGHGQRRGKTYSTLRVLSGACVGLPTCRLSYTDSEQFEPRTARRTRRPRLRRPRRVHRHHRMRTTMLPTRHQNPRLGRLGWRQLRPQTRRLRRRLHPGPLPHRRRKTIPLHGRPATASPTSAPPSSTGTRQKPRAQARQPRAQAHRPPPPTAHPKKKWAPSSTAWASPAVLEKFRTDDRTADPPGKTQPPRWSSIPTSKQPSSPPTPDR